jgi:hypothetical protein
MVMVFPGVALGSSAAAKDLATQESANNRRTLREKCKVRRGMGSLRGVRDPLFMGRPLDDEPIGGFRPEQLRGYLRGANAARSNACECAEVEKSWTVVQHGNTDFTHRRSNVP